MDGSAVSKIQDNAAASLLGEKVLETYCPVAALPDSFRIADLEPYQKHRSALRAKFSTSSIDGFVDAYVMLRNGNKHTVFVDQEKMSANVIFDIGTQDEPGHCRQSAILTLKKTAAFIAYENLFARTDLDQRLLAEWLEDWRDYISCIDSNGLYLPIKQVINTVRKITIEGVRKSDSAEENFSSSKSTLESITAKSEAGEPPAVLIFDTEPYTGLPNIKLRFRISIRTGGDKVRFGAFRIQEGVDTESIGRIFAEIIAEQMPEGCSVIIGSIDTK
jgi:uncharacterized protein YfdQ (DUF2303 family)